MNLLKSLSTPRSKTACNAIRRVCTQKRKRVSSRTSPASTHPMRLRVDPEIHLQTLDQSADELADAIIRTLIEREIIRAHAP